MNTSRSDIAVVIGAAANELVCAHYLARAGWRVTVLRQHGAESENPIAAGWVPPALVRDLALDAHGYQVWQPDPWIAVALPDGGRLELSSDLVRSVEAIRRVSARDAARWPAFCERMHRLAQLLADIYVEPPLDPLGKETSDWIELAATALRVRRLGREGIEDLMRVVPMSVADLLDDWFENDALKGVLGAAGIMHLYQGPRAAGTAALLLHHAVGNPCGVFRPSWSNIGTALAQKPGIEVRTAEVRQIEVRGGQVSAVTLASGEQIATQLVISGEDPQRTLLRRLDATWLPAEYVQAVKRIRCRGVVAKLTLAVDRPAAFSRLAIAPSLDYLERAYDAAKYGAVSQSPYIEAASGGLHGDRHVDVHFQYAPYALRNAVWTPERRTALGELAIETLSRHVSDFGSSVVERSILAPPDLEQVYGFPQGQLYHAEPALDQMWWMRPVPGWARYRTPFDGLYLCGPGTHPASVSGIAGYNAVRQIIRDLK